MALTDTGIKALKPGAKAFKAYDGKGLYLVIAQSGGKLWRYKYRHLDKEKLLTLGAYPETSLAEARVKRDAAAKQVSAGSDPSHTRKMDKIAASISAGNTFADVAADYIKTKLAFRSDSTRTKARWLLANLSPLHRRPIAEIVPAELLTVLRRIEATGRLDTAKATRAFASRVFLYGVATVRCEGNPAALLLGALSNPVVKHRAAILEPLALGAFLRAVDCYAGTPTVKLAMQILPHVALRPSELRMALWQEIDWDEAIWHVPAERTKLRRPHAVPLSAQVLALLRELEALTGAGQAAYLFPALAKHNRPMSENTLNQAYRRMDYGADVVTAHGFRATFSTLANESGKWQPDAIERALAHGDSNAVRGAYSRGVYWQERVLMAAWWSGYLDALRNGGEVVTFETRSKTA
jgi:integrase